VILSRFSGNIKTGVKIEVGGAFVSGSIEIKYEDKWVVAVLEVKVLGQTYSKTVKLLYVGDI
jgi:hypothetical protein